MTKTKERKKKERKKSENRKETINWYNKMQRKKES